MGKGNVPAPDEPPEHSPGWLFDYTREHNELLDFAAEVAHATLDAGATFVIENPVDCGRPGSRYYRWQARRHCPIWLTTPLLGVMERDGVRQVSGCQCRLGGDFRKATTLLVGGPKARFLVSFDDLD